MTLIWTALPALLLGVLLCLFGQRVARIGMGLLGAVIGFMVGVAGFQAVAGTSAASMPAVQWIVGGIAALLVGGLAYSFYVVGVLVLMGSLGWQLGWWFGGLTGFDTGWTAIMAAAMAMLAVAGGLVLNLPRALLVLSTAVAGSILIVGSLPVFLPGLADTVWMAWVRANTGWAELALVVVGVVVQWRVGGKANLRAAYSS